MGLWDLLSRATPLSSVTQPTTYPAPAICKGACFSRDPSIIKGPDGSYYRFSTGNGLKIARALSLYDPWVETGMALPNGSSIHVQGYTGTSLWAPDVSLINGTYYMYYTESVIDTLNSAIGVATSPNLTSGSWTDHGSTGIESTEASQWNALDGNLVRRADGSFQLIFGSHVKDIWWVQPTPNLLKNATKPAGPISYNSTGAHAQEGPFMYYHGGYYYLFISAGNCCGFSPTNHPTDGTEYHVTVCRSQNSTAGFVDKNGVDCTKGGATTVLGSHGDVYAPGGQGVFNDPQYGPILYYMYYNTSISYRGNETVFGWNPIDFSSSWPVLVSAPSS